MRRLLAALALSLGACHSLPDPPARGPARLEIHNVQDLVACTLPSAFSPPCDIPDHACVRLVNEAKRVARLAPSDEEQGWAIVYQYGLLIVRADGPTHRIVASHLDAERARLPLQEK